MTGTADDASLELAAPSMLDGQSLVGQLQTLAELRSSGSLTEGEFSLAKTHLLRRLAAADAPAPEPQQPPTVAAALSPPAVAPARGLLPVLAAAVGGGSTGDAIDASSTQPPPLFPPSAAAMDDAVARLVVVLSGDDERARLSALRSLHADRRTLCSALSGGSDDGLCAEMVRSIGAVLHVPCGRSSRRLAALLLVACGSSAADGHEPTTLSSATWNWLFALDAPEPGMALVLEALPDADLCQSLDAIAFGRPERWRAIFSAAPSPAPSPSRSESPTPALGGMPPQRWLAILIRLCLACMSTPSQLTLLRSRFGHGAGLAEVLADAALPHASKQRATAAASTDAGSVYDPQFGDVGAHAARLLALRLLAVPICGAQLSTDTLSKVVEVLRDASVEGASSVRIGIVGVAGLFGLATQLFARAKGAGRAAGAVISAIAAVVGQPAGPRWPEVARCYVLHALGLLLCQPRSTLPVAAVVVPPLLGQFRVGYNLQSLDVLLHLVVHPRLGPNSALDILHWLEPLCLGDALHGRAATVPVLLLLERFAGRRREEARRQSQLANDPRYTSEDTVRGALEAGREQYRSVDDGWGAYTFLQGGKHGVHRPLPSVDGNAVDSARNLGDGEDDRLEHVPEKVLRCVRRLAAATVSAVKILAPGEASGPGGALGEFTATQQGAWVRATLAVELLNKLAQLQDSVISAAVLDCMGELQSPAALTHSSGAPSAGMRRQMVSAGASMLAVQRALDMMERTCEADALWGSEGDGGRWARSLSNKARSVGPTGAFPQRADRTAAVAEIMAEGSGPRLSIRDGAVSAPLPEPQHHILDHDVEQGQRMEQPVSSGEGAVVPLPPLQGAAARMRRKPANGSDVVTTIFEDSRELHSASSSMVGYDRPDDAFSRGSVRTAERRRPHKRAHTSLGHTPDVSSARSDAITVHLPQIASAAVDSPMNKPTEATQGAADADASYHQGSFDRLITGLEQRVAAASGQVNDLKRRLERSVLELERRAQNSQQAGDPWRGVIDGRIQKLQRDLRGALLRERKALQSLELAAAQQDHSRLPLEVGVEVPVKDGYIKEQHLQQFTQAQSEPVFSNADIAEAERLASDAVMFSNERHFQRQVSSEDEDEAEEGSDAEHDYDDKEEYDENESIGEEEAYDSGAEYTDNDNPYHDEDENSIEDASETDDYGSAEEDPQAVDDLQQASRGAKLEHHTHDLDGMLHAELAVRRALYSYPSFDGQVFRI